MGGTALALPRWSRDPLFYRERVFRGTALEIGPGYEPLTRYPADLPHITGLVCVDHNDLPGYDSTWHVSDACKLDCLEGATFDVVYSSHCLEHVWNPSEALALWWQHVAPGGYLVVLVPSWLHYERLIWPPSVNTDHKTAWVLNHNVSGTPLPFIRGLINEANKLTNGVILRATTLDTGFNPNDTEDQTRLGTCECGHEIVVRRPGLLPL